LAEQTNIVENLTGKPMEELTETELASLSETIETRRKSLREALEKEQFGTLAKTAKDMATALGWERLVKITLTPNATNEEYEVGLATVTVGVKSPVKRATPDTNGGKITINKIAEAKGGIARFKAKDKEYAKIQDVVKALKQPDGTPEADRCWDISKKGISASDIVTKYHATEVTLVYTNGNEQLVKEAVEEVKSARAVA